MEKLSLSIRSEIASKLKLFAPLKVEQERFLYNSVIALFILLHQPQQIFQEHLKNAWRLSHETLHSKTFHTNF